MDSFVGGWAYVVKNKKKKKTERKNTFFLSFFLHKYEGNARERKEDKKRMKLLQEGEKESARASNQVIN